MAKGQEYNGQSGINRDVSLREKDASSDDFVLEKNIFSNIFEKDIRRVFIYKKAERLAKAIHLIAPAFADSPSLRDRIDSIAVGLVDAAILAPGAARQAMSRELLALSSVLSIARTGGLLSSMNSELISREAHSLLQEIAAYEEPRLFLDEAPSLAEISRRAGRGEERPQPRLHAPAPARRLPTQGHQKGQVKDTSVITSDRKKDRREAVVSVMREKGKVSIKDISTHIRDVSEKTIQRELQSLIEEGVVAREGERRWSTYHILGESGGAAA